MYEEESIFDLIIAFISFSVDILFTLFMISVNIVKIILTFYLLMMLINYLPIIIIISFFAPSFGLLIFQIIGALWDKAPTGG